MSTLVFTIWFSIQHRPSLHENHRSGCITNTCNIHRARAHDALNTRFHVLHVDMFAYCGPKLGFYIGLPHWVFELTSSHLHARATSKVRARTMHDKRIFIHAAFYIEFYMFGFSI